MRRFQIGLHQLCAAVTGGLRVRRGATALQLASEKGPGGEANRRRIAPSGVGWARINHQALQPVRTCYREETDALPHGVQLDEHTRIMQPLDEGVERLIGTERR